MLPSWLRATFAFALPAAVAGSLVVVGPRGTRVWHLGIKDRSGVHILKVRVVG